MIGPAIAECPAWMLQRARGAIREPIRTGIINAINSVALESTRDATEAGLIAPVLIGAREAINEAAAAISWDIADLEIIEADGEQAAAVAGAAAAGRGELAALMKGHLHTDVFMRACLSRDAGLRIGKPLTHVFVLTLPGREGSLILTDCALLPAPDVEMKKAVITNSVAMAQALGVKRPKVALLSATEVVSEHIPSTIEAETLTKWAATELPAADVRGPLAFDLAVSAEAVRVKGITGKVAGAADVIVVPEIVSGNALFKSLVQFAGACAAGLVVGAKVPLLLTSRADPPAARLGSAALAAILAGTHND